MIAEREEYVVVVESFVPSIEITLGHREGMSKVEYTIHVGIGKCLKEFAFFIGLDNEKLVSFPDVSGSLLEGDEFISTCGVFHAIFNYGGK
jgi:hypothetical protein